MGKVIAVCISERKGTPKRNIGACRLIAGKGLEGDAHAGFGHRQVSLLARESADLMRAKGLEIQHGDFGENLTTEGIDLKSLPIGTTLRVGNEVLLRVTQIGKECHDRCAIYQQIGDCIMPREGVFAEVLQGGIVHVGDEISRADDLPSHSLSSERCPSISAAILTISDKGAAGEREDRSGEVIREILTKMGAEVKRKEIVPDEQHLIERALRKFAENFDLVVTTGGTGIGPRDVTPEATRSVITKELPGFGEAMRAAGLTKTPHAILSRALAGICGKCLILNLPGSPKAVRECLEAVVGAIPHAIELVRGGVVECGSREPNREGRA